MADTETRIEPPKPPSFPDIASDFTYRLAVNPDTGEHGYEIGRWPAHSDLNDPAQFEVIERCYGQEEAAARALALNADPSHPKAQAQAKAADDSGDEDSEADEPHRRQHVRHRK